MSIVFTVDSYADKITKIADEMRAAAISSDPNTGAVAILRDIAADLRQQVRHQQILPSRVDIASISCFGGMSVQASAAAQRTDLPEKITKLFAAARTAPPAIGTKLTSGEVDAVLREAGLIEMEARMAMKNHLEAAGLVDYGTQSALARR